ncbi:MAG: hypothetical protein HY722_02265 [Planctomycetes bacterium]|nr:hypothetical protein [Planctomycetota bacterium]
MADALLGGWRGAPLAAAERALAAYAEDLTLRPAAPPLPRVAALREAGFDDAGVLAATEITAYFNFVNRLAHGLGVELEGPSK